METILALNPKVISRKKCGWQINLQLFPAAQMASTAIVSQFVIAFFVLCEKSIAAPGAILSCSR